MDKSKHHLLLVLVLFIFSSTTTDAEIRNIKIIGDSRPLIIFEEEFGFTPTGSIAITISDVSIVSSSSDSDLSLFGFFLFSNKTLINDRMSNPNNSSTTISCLLSSPDVRPLFTFCELLNMSSSSSSYKYNYSFPVGGEYGLYFANCATDTTTVSMSVRTEMFNARPDGTRDYLSIGQSPVPTLYACLALAYPFFLAIWAYICIRRRPSVRLFHLLMAGLLLAKFLNLASAAEHQHYISVTGTPHQGWDIAFRLFQCLLNTLFFALCYLIAVGWPFLRPCLLDCQKRILKIIILLQVLANLYGYGGPCIIQVVDWLDCNKGPSFLADHICFLVILFNYRTSVRVLSGIVENHIPLEDDRRAANRVLTLWIQLYFQAAQLFLVWSRYKLFLIRYYQLLSYDNHWISAAVEEAATLLLYFFMFYLFRPIYQRNQKTNCHFWITSYMANSVLLV